jgi:hypothetical protein
MKQSNPRPMRPRTTRRIAGHAQQDHILDPYQRRQKLHEGTVCPQCGALYHAGRWQWGTKGEGTDQELCAACRRINDKFPAGVVTLRGDFAQEHKEEMISLARHQEAAEKKEHPPARSRRDKPALKNAKPGRRGRGWSPQCEAPTSSGAASSVPCRRYRHFVKLAPSWLKVR